MDNFNSVVRLSFLISVLASFPAFVSLPAMAESSVQNKGVAKKVTSVVSKTHSNRNRTEISANVDCQHNFNIDKGNTQKCFSVSKLRLSHYHHLGTKVKGIISLNPFAKPDHSEDKYTIDSALPNSSTGKFGLIDYYAIIWTPKANLDLALEEYGGGALIPDMSGLSLASKFDSAGWGQTALSATYHLPAGDGIDVKFVLGNGEGENGENLDPQQYFGFELNAQFIKGVEVNIGASIDGNSIGSDRRTWLNSVYSKCDPSILASDVDTGFSTRRFAAGAALNGDLPSARGLKFGIGWQKVTFSDLNKKKNSVPTVTELAGCDSLEIADLFLEDATNETANTVIHSVFGVNGGYRILDTYVLGFDYQTRTVETGVVSFFGPCESFVGQSCEGRKDLQNTISQVAITYGITYEISRDLALIAEYHTREFDQEYNKFRYETANEELSSRIEIFNGRIAYRWN